MNWGKGIAIAMGAFMIFIVTLVVKVNSVNFELVSDTYYEDELLFNDRYVAKQRAFQYVNECQSTAAGESMFVSIPADLIGDLSTAKVKLRHPKTAAKDLVYDWVQGDNEVQLNLAELDQGTIYTMELQMDKNGEEFLIEKSLRIP